MKKILLTLLSVLLLTGPAVNAEQGGRGPFKLGIQAANASTLDDSHILYAKKKKASKKGKATTKSKKKSKKTPKED